LSTRILALSHAAHPEECLGLLFGPRPGEARELWPLENVAPERTSRFEAEGSELVRAVLSAHARGQELVAIYHSHPAGPAVPSVRDVALARWDVPYLIADPGARVMRAWLLLPSVREVRLVVV
jgi:proteasome lid subunit RPN8/RPN11